MPGRTPSVLKSALFVAALAPFAVAQAQPLSLQFKNESGLPNSQVYIGFVGPEALNATNAATNAALSRSR